MEPKPGEGEPVVPSLLEALGHEGFRTENAFFGETLPQAKRLAEDAPDGWADILEETHAIGREILERDMPGAESGDHPSGWDMVNNEVRLSEITDRLNAARHERQLPPVRPGTIWGMWSVWNSTNSVIHETSPEIVVHQLRNWVSVPATRWKGLHRIHIPADEIWNKAVDEMTGMIERNYPDGTASSDQGL